MTLTNEDTPEAESSQNNVEETALLEGATAEGATAEGATVEGAMALSEVSAEPAAAAPGDSVISEATQKWRRPLTPEQHQQKILQDRARRAAKARDAAAGPSTQDGPDESTLPQAERDLLYRQRLGAMLQADEAARRKRVAANQQRHDEARGKGSNRR